MTPKTGHVVKARIGRYGPMVEIEGAEGEKSRFASLKKGQLIESITLEEALELFALPREVGELDGEKLVVGLGKYGPYVRYGKSFASLAKGDDPYTLTRERAVEIVREHQAAVAAANTPLKSFAEDPDMLVKKRPIRRLHRLQGQELPDSQRYKTRGTHTGGVSEDRRRIEKVNPKTVIR